MWSECTQERQRGVQLLAIHILAWVDVLSLPGAIPACEGRRVDITKWVPVPEDKRGSTPRLLLFPKREIKRVI
jgi:hypothetical protein